MRKKIPVVAVKGREEKAARLAGLPGDAQVALGELAGALKDGLLSFTTTAGLLVMWQLMVAEMTELIGPKHAKQPGRAGNWHGTTKGSVVLGGRTVQTQRPRGRTAEGTEIGLDSWELFASRDLLTQVTLERMLAGVATRRHGEVWRPARAGARCPVAVDVEIGGVGTVRESDRGESERAHGPSS